MSQPVLGTEGVEFIGFHRNGKNSFCDHQFWLCFSFRRSLTLGWGEISIFVPPPHTKSWMKIARKENFKFHHNDHNNNIFELQPLFSFKTLVVLTGASSMWKQVFPSDTVFVGIFETVCNFVIINAHCILSQMLFPD